MLKHQFYESMYPDHNEPATLTDISEKLEEVLQALRASTPRHPLSTWTDKEVQRWLGNLPVEGLKETSERILSGIDGSELSTLSNEDLEKAGMESRVHRSQLLKAREFLIKRDAAAAEDKQGEEEDDGAFGQALGLLAGSLDSDPSVDQAEAFEMLAQAAAKTGKVSETIKLLRKALQMREVAQGDNHADVAKTLELLSGALEAAGSVEEAEDMLLRAVQLNEQLHGKLTEPVAVALETLMAFLDRQGRSSDAEKLMEKVESIRARPAAELFHKYVTFGNISQGLLYIFVALAFLQLVVPEFLEPMKASLPAEWNFQMEQAAAQTRLMFWGRVHGAGHPSTLVHMEGVARVLEKHKRWPQAREAWTSVLRVTEEQLDPKDPMAALALSRIGTIHLREGHAEQGQQPLTRAIAIWSTTQEYFEVTNLALAKSALGEVLRLKGRYTEAKPLFRQALKIQEDNFEEVDDEDLAHTLSGLGHVLAATGAHEEARNATARAIKLTQGLVGLEPSKQLLDRVLEAGEAMEAMGDFVNAGGFFKQAADLAMKVHGVHDVAVARSLASLATCLFSVGGRGEEAERVSKTSVGIAEKGLGKGHPSTAIFLVRRGGLLAASGRYDEAESYLSSARSILASYEEAREGADMAAALTNLGGVLLSKGDAATALTHMEKSLAIRQKSEGELHPSVGDAAGNLAIVYASLGKKDKADIMLNTAQRAWQAAYGEAEGLSRLDLAQARVNSHYADPPGGHPRA